MTPLLSFQDVVRPLCERIGIAPPGEHRLSVALSVDDGLTVGLLGHQEGFLVVIAEIAAPVDPRDAQRLLPLLAANQFSAEHPALIGALEPDGGRFSLWTRESLSELDEPALMALFDRVLAAASSVRDWLLEPLAPEPAAHGFQLRA
ncbi:MULTISPECIES: CesT family type III secretion system chaperone [unclassified Rhizobacter]|uniref:CesT family type III secretion system chaperone n=1 Tax=unclassified Rhizobacter TaxID=2640088 RepID=UPI0006F5B540|nr:MULTISPECIES: CesT family type III secretion system chaperone [unclassified Rhizobacter]KQU73492.1 hypothetical protein ASC88_04575 [Rhizobacter sp. Root29]KQV98677.1 hypothetical protein ASC98_08405 [Rhizobacter sp. Root1238]KRB04930.1 hypothetical protein ASE08_13560 [Rhizobacter sp. Root16D2]